MSNDRAALAAQRQRFCPRFFLRYATGLRASDLIGIAPIAEALIKTLAGKARTGRLDEMKALALLRQIVSL